MYSFNGWVIFHCVYVPQLSYPFVYRWTSRLLPCPWPPKYQTFYPFTGGIYVSTLIWALSSCHCLRCWQWWKLCYVSFQTVALGNSWQLSIPVCWDTPSWNPVIILWRSPRHMEKKGVFWMTVPAEFSVDSYHWPPDLPAQCHPIIKAQEKERKMCPAKSSKS